ncbi:hypothetical protein OsI_03052 [Oryza sativa Indica Group]|uniref:Protein kinase domain-containing protein n=1 Tax=Oryza sativa subsp. indica TaxID=39946 RepID=A2WT64_ORYSI|nr:hypothetical protein OsI_03052 [Oryza sativa Indica Group]
MVIEVCCCLGLAANVAQLAGLDVITLVKVIKNRVETVRQNKEDCELLAERADMILDLLRRVQESKVIEDPDMWKPTEGLKSTLRRAAAIVKSCQEDWSYAYRFCKGGRIARELRKVLKDLKFYILPLIGMITIINHDQNTRYYYIPETDVVKPQDASANNAGKLVALEETGLKKFTLSELEVATDNFSLEKQIGIGAFSIVYKVSEQKSCLWTGATYSWMLRLKPKICDFGTSKALRPGQDMDCTGIVVGSRGYMAPEYKQGGCVSLKTDVYSFGATLLEIIRGSRIPLSTLELSDESRDFGPLNKWAWELWRGGNLMEFIDPSLHGETHSAAEIQRWVQIALLCVQLGPEERPDMWDVVLMLSSDSTVILPKPSRPAYY